MGKVEEGMVMATWEEEGVLLDAEGVGGAAGNMEDTVEAEEAERMSSLLGQNSYLFPIHSLGERFAKRLYR